MKPEKTKTTPILTPDEVEHLARSIGRPAKGAFRQRVMAKIHEIAKDSEKSKPQKIYRKMGREMGE